VVERGGGPKDARIFVLEETAGKWTLRVFLALPVSSTSAASDERGLLGLAFHPDYAKNRRYFLYYMPSKQAFEKDSTVIAEFRADATLLKDEGRMPRRILGIEQPYANHNGGSLGFGPKDGKLYIGTGDGGAAGDPKQHGQDLSSLLGKMLRIDVDDTSDGRAYGIPQDNPFVQSNSQAGTLPRPEIWAYGLRNPWKWSFDPETGKLWAGDVGQNNREEITVIGKGENQGWRSMEGFACFDPPRACPREGLTLPIADIPRNEAQSITGGYVYRGNASSPYYGAYFFGDWETRAWWVIMPDHKPGTPPRKLGLLPDQPSSFGTDAAGNLYMVGYKQGAIYRADL
jgi:glucose/arabinose dehydrogenase